MPAPRKGPQRTPAVPEPSRRSPPVGRPQAGRPRDTAPGELTPDQVRRAWSLQHPERPEVASALERLYRRRF
ncbi:MAG: hypothetical protein VKP62_15015 [Candidatus Sericytochromatia bacterium]|nr:hypothetical protein [Candidatus Sericytochromatia bacterium]